MRPAPRSKEFDDVYFSREDGLAETRHVFLASNNLPDAWRGKERFVIAETGFGTGLNFLAAWKLFRETADTGARLNFISVEKYPLLCEEIQEYLGPWQEEFGYELPRLLECYPARIPGFHRVEMEENVSLTLAFDDVNRALAELDAKVDCWFLDGFKPATNPEMWSEAVFQNMARLSAPGASFATFTAAGAVKRGLQAAGFTVSKIKGYGTKRDMLVGAIPGTPTFEEKVGVPGSGKRIAIIGAGLAGTACAHVLKRRGFEPVIYEAGAEIAPGASGNPLALYNPRLSAQRSAESDFYGAAFMLAWRTFEGIENIGWKKCGSLHLMSDEKRAKKLEQCAVNWGWPEDNMQVVDAREASGIAGVELAHKALWLPDAGVVCPKKLCEEYARGVEINLNAKIESLDNVKADVVILACGMGAKRFVPALPLKAVRGQITQVKARKDSAALRVNLCYGGYMTPAVDGVHVVGSTFQRWLDHSEIMPQDDADNLAKLAENIPAFAGAFEITERRAAVRATTDGHFPIAGKLRDDLYVSTAHGSHGVVTSIAAAHLLADMIEDGPRSLPVSVIEKLGAARYI